MRRDDWKRITQKEVIIEAQGQDSSQSENLKETKDKDMEGEVQGEEKKAPSAKKITLHDFRAILTWENK